MSNKLLSVENLTMKFGGLIAIDNLSFSADESQITSIIGPNGAGKTTLFNIINGSIKPDKGSIKLNDDNITGYEPHQLFELGVLRTFQIAHEFSSLTVKDNLMVVSSNQKG